MNEATRMKRILVVDDEQQVCHSVGKVLRRKGYDVEQALCVAAALDRIEDGMSVDLIIADLMMPQAGGVELLKVTRDRWPDIPVLIITGYGSIASAVETTRLGAAGFLPKPFTPGELEEAVDKAVVHGPWKVTHKAPEQMEVLDVDLPFDPGEMEKATSAHYVSHLTRSDMPIVTAPPKPAADFCAKGARACKRFKAKGACADQECPIITAERRKAERSVRISVPAVLDPIDVDMPFSASEVAAATSDAYVAALGRGDMPVIGRWASGIKETRRVLVVDDEAVVVNSIRKILSSRGYTVEAAYNGMDAIARITAGTYDLVLLDLRMPGLSGMELLPKIKKYRPNLPVAIVTGYSSIETAVEAIRSGASDYLGKPFSPDELYQLAQRMLSRAA